MSNNYPNNYPMEVRTTFFPDIDNKETFEKIIVTVKLITTTPSFDTAISYAIKSISEEIGDIWGISIKLSNLSFEKNHKREEYTYQFIMEKD